MANYKYDIFVSYARRDYDIVFPIVKEIEAMGVKIWFDIDGVESGEEFKTKIIEAIDNSDSLIFMCSANSLVRKWTRKEVDYASKQGKKIRPILLSGENPTKGWFAFDYGDIDCIDINNPIQKKKLFKNLRDTYCLQDNRQEQKETSSNSSHDETKKFFLKVKPNVDCAVIIDEEEIGKAKANKITKFPLRPGEYTLSFISKEDGIRLIRKNINIFDRDILETPLFAPEKVHQNDKHNTFVNEENLIEKLPLNLQFNFPDAPTMVFTLNKSGMEYKLNKKEYAKLASDFINSDKKRKVFEAGAAGAAAAGVSAASVGAGYAAIEAALIIVEVSLASVLVPVAAGAGLLAGGYYFFRDSPADKKLKELFDIIGLNLKTTRTEYKLPIFKTEKNRLYFTNRFA